MISDMDSDQDGLHVIPVDILDDVVSRFILPMPSSARSDHIR